MTIRIDIDDPNKPDIVALLRDGETYGASLYPAESNHFTALDTLSASNVRFVVARNIEGVAVGTGAIALFGDWAELKRMWVVPSARGCGVSKAILADLESMARTAGITLIRLETGVKNYEAIALYQQAGFTRCEPFADYRPDPLSLFMQKVIGAQPNQ